MYMYLMMNNYILFQLWAIIYILMILISVLSLTFDTHQDFRVTVNANLDRLSETNHTCDTIRPLNPKVNKKIIFLFNILLIYPTNLWRILWQIVRVF